AEYILPGDEKEAAK
ncbi:MAG: hypothetical protein ACRBBV_14350, partial [Paracoccaceae bacterium]